jgi:thiol:disulfide interchange protein DsbD
VLAPVSPTTSGQPSVPRRRISAPDSINTASRINWPTSWDETGWGLAASALPLIGAVASVPLAGTNQTLHAAATENNGGIRWLPFSISKIDELEAQGRSIFVDFTADWCITCKINERVALESPAVIEAFARDEVAALRADWTRQDPSITRMLEANGRAGVPLYLFYPKPGPRGERHGPIILPQILTAATIIRAMQSQ